MDGNAGSASVTGHAVGVGARRTGRSGRCGATSRGPGRAGRRRAGRAGSVAPRPGPRRPRGSGAGRVRAVRRDGRADGRRARRRGLPACCGPCPGSSPARAGRDGCSSSSALLHLLIQAHRGLTGSTGTGRDRTVPGRLSGQQGRRARQPGGERPLARARAWWTPSSTGWRPAGSGCTAPTTGRWALLLSFAPPGGFLDATVLAGERLARGAALLPGLRPVPGAGRRARTSTTRAAGRPAAPESLAEVQRRFAELLAADPVGDPDAGGVSAARRSGRPARGSAWRLRDATGRPASSSGCRASRGRCWPARAAARSPIFGEWNAARVPAAQRAAGRQGRRSAPRARPGGVMSTRWSDVVTAALLGTDRRPVPDTCRRLGRPGSERRDPATRCWIYAARHRASRCGPVLGCRRCRRADRRPRPETVAPAAGAGACWAGCWPDRDRVDQRLAGAGRDSGSGSEPTIWSAVLVLAARRLTSTGPCSPGLGARGIWFCDQNPQWHLARRRSVPTLHRRCAGLRAAERHATGRRTRRGGAGRLDPIGQLRLEIHQAFADRDHQEPQP